MTETTSAIDRLRQLPDVFRGADLTTRFGWTSKTASQYLYLWKRRGLVDGLGGKSDVYFNQLVLATPNWSKALVTAMPSATIVGIEALRLAGWTTQIPQRPAIAVDERERVHKLAKYQVEAKPASWFAACAKGLSRPSPAAPRVLAPAWALADLLAAADWGRMGLWPDDIDLDSVAPADRAQWKVACKAFGTPADRHIPFTQMLDALT